MSENTILLSSALAICVYLCEFDDIVRVFNEFDSVGFVMCAVAVVNG